MGNGESDKKYEELVKKAKDAIERMNNSGVNTETISRVEGFKKLITDYTEFLDAVNGIRELKNMDNRKEYDNVIDSFFKQDFVKYMRENIEMAYDSYSSRPNNIMLFFDGNFDVRSIMKSPDEYTKYDLSSINELQKDIENREDYIKYVTQEYNNNKFDEVLKSNKQHAAYSFGSELLYKAFMLRMKEVLGELSEQKILAEINMRDSEKYKADLKAYGTKIDDSVKKFNELFEKNVKSEDEILQVFSDIAVNYSKMRDTNKKVENLMYVSDDIVIDINKYLNDINPIKEKLHEYLQNIISQEDKDLQEYNLIKRDRQLYDNFKNYEDISGEKLTPKQAKKVKEINEGIAKRQEQLNSYIQAVNSGERSLGKVFACLDFEKENELLVGSRRKLLFKIDRYNQFVKEKLNELYDERNTAASDMLNEIRQYNNMIDKTKTRKQVFDYAVNMDKLLEDYKKKQKLFESFKKEYDVDEKLINNTDKLTYSMEGVDEQVEKILEKEFINKQDNEYYDIYEKKLNELEKKLLVIEENLSEELVGKESENIEKITLLSNEILGYSKYSLDEDYNKILNRFQKSDVINSYVDACFKPKIELIQKSETKLSNDYNAIKEKAKGFIPQNRNDIENTFNNYSNEKKDSKLKFFSICNNIQNDSFVNKLEKCGVKKSDEILGIIRKAQENAENLTYDLEVFLGQARQKSIGLINRKEKDEREKEEEEKKQEEEKRKQKEEEKKQEEEKNRLEDERKKKLDDAKKEINNVYNNIYNITYNKSIIIELNKLDKLYNDYKDDTEISGLIEKQFEIEKLYNNGVKIEKDIRLYGNENFIDGNYWSFIKDYVDLRKGTELEELETGKSSMRQHIESKKGFLRNEYIDLRNQSEQYSKYMDKLQNYKTNMEALKIYNPTLVTLFCKKDNKTVDGEISRIEGLINNIKDFNKSFEDIAKLQRANDKEAEDKYKDSIKKMNDLRKDVINKKNIYDKAVKKGVKLEAILNLIKAEDKYDKAYNEAHKYGLAKVDSVIVQKGNSVIPKFSNDFSDDIYVIADSMRKDLGRDYKKKKNTLPDALMEFGNYIYKDNNFIQNRKKLEEKRNNTNPIAHLYAISDQLSKLSKDKQKDYILILNRTGFFNDTAKYLQNEIEKDTYRDNTSSILGVELYFRMKNMSDDIGMGTDPKIEEKLKPYTKGFNDLKNKMQKEMERFYLDVSLNDTDREKIYEFIYNTTFKMKEAGFPEREMEDEIDFVTQYEKIEAMKKIENIALSKNVNEENYDYDEAEKATDIIKKADERDREVFSYEALLNEEKDDIKREEKKKKFINNKELAEKELFSFDYEKLNLEEEKDVIDKMVEKVTKKNKNINKTRNKDNIEDDFEEKNDFEKEEDTAVTNWEKLSKEDKQTLKSVVAKDRIRLAQIKSEKTKKTKKIEKMNANNLGL